ncbi:MAG TPA: POTRA domain-containing protein, partial [Armatimonadota bacterium]|nr:POTRA domain-containing protein [Armatimonadota bacterium]
MILALVMFAALLLPSSAAFAQNEVKVTRIVISGNQNINKETIESAIKLAPGAEYSKEATEKDRAAINALGYFSAVSVRTEETPEGLSVIYDVVENPVVKGIEVIGSEPISDETIKG